MSRIAIIEDDRTTRRFLRHWLEQAGHTVTEHGTAAEALAADDPVDVACIDLGLGEDSGLEVMQQLRARDPSLEVIIVTAETGSGPAVEAMRAGAYDYVTKPIDRERLLTSLDRALDHRRLRADVDHLSTELRERSALDTLVGDSPPMRHLADQVSRIFESDVPVCIFGESGTGKELVARAVHRGSNRKDGPFIAVNCASIAESLQESELFGHERGAFTGAHAMQRGRFEQADGGILFLDELGEMSPSTQAALLRTLQEKKVRRVGGAKEIPVDVRIVCATHRNLEQLVAEGKFREDLYFRLVVYPVTVPPLRSRTSDIPSLVAHFLDKLSGDVGRRPASVSPAALDALTCHAWPGNVRELQNVIHRAMLACDGHTLDVAHLPPQLTAPAAPAPATVTAPATGSPSPGQEAPAPAPPPEPEPEIFDLRTLEARAIRRALEKARGNMTEAARLLGIGRATLYRKMAREENLAP